MKTVLITGASRGLGKSLSDNFAANGWTVYAAARNPDAIEAGPNVIPVALDLSDDGSVVAAAEFIGGSGNKLDVLINNAGTNPKDSKVEGFFASTFRIAEFSPAAVDQSLWINALMPMRLTSLLLGSLSDDAVILNVSSWLGSISQKSAPGHYGYSGSKALLNMFTRGLALELEGSGRSAVALNPGWMKTDMGGANANTTPADVASQVLRLLSDGTLSRSNGAFLNADGSPHAW